LESIGTALEISLHESVSKGNKFTIHIDYGLNDFFFVMNFSLNLFFFRICSSHVFLNK
jgi:hypothetical protein